MKLKLVCQYEARFLPVIWHFVVESARAFGASEREAKELGLASEEVAGHIIESFPGGGGLEEPFEIHCETTGEGLRFVFHDLGLPIDVAALPRYDTGRPDETIDGLRLYLVEKLVDSFELQNRGHEGWRLVITRRLARMQGVRPAGVEAGAEELAHAAERLTVRRATPDDAAAIVELAYRNYHYTYAKEVFYYAERLAEELRAGNVVSFLAVDPTGRPVGQMALLSSPESHQVAEVGALMVRPEYRRSLGLLHLVRAAHHHGTSPEAPFALYFSNLVTAHTMSQKASGFFRFHPMGLAVSVHERAAFLGMEGVSRQRESLLHAVTWLRPPAALQLHVPGRHLEVAGRLFAGLGPVVELVASEAARPDGGPGATLAVHVDRECSLATVRVSRGGPDLEARLRRCLHDLDGEDVKTVHVRIPAWFPAAADVEARVAALGLFFCGFVAETPERWHLLYARLCRQHFEFGQIQLVDPLALELRDHVEGSFLRTVPG